MNKIRIRQIASDHNQYFSWSVELPNSEVWFCNTWQAAIEFSDDVIRMQHDGQWSLGLDPSKVQNLLRDEEDNA